MTSASKRSADSAVSADDPLNVALDEIRRLRHAIETHRDAVQNHRRAKWIEGIDIDLWLVLSERRHR